MGWNKMHCLKYRNLGLPLHSVETDTNAALAYFFTCITAQMDYTHANDIYFLLA